MRRFWKGDGGQAAELASTREALTRALAEESAKEEEARIALEEWQRRFPIYRVHEDELGYVHSSNVRGFTSVPVSV